jgi:hypothetical protein
MARKIPYRRKVNNEKNAACTNVRLPTGTVVKFGRTRAITESGMMTVR